MHKSINPSVIFFNLQVADYFNYIELMESSIANHKEKLIKSFEEQAQSLESEEDKDALFDFSFSDDYRSLDESFTYILRKSVFITLYSFMESELLTIAKRLEKKTSSRIKLNDISHRGIRNYLFYIENVNNIDVNISKKDRDSFIKYNGLRNYFVHNDDSLFPTKKYNEFKSLPYINFKEYPYHEKSLYQVENIEKEFNHVYLDLINNLFNKIFKALENY